MKDLDFDELDRAVNSLMTNVPKSEISKPEATEKTLDITSTLGDSTPPPSIPGEPAAPAPTAPVAAHLSRPTPPAAASAARPPLAARRGGRFMDVVHPSSDMKTPTVPSRLPVSRQGVTIAPSATALHPLSAVSAPAPQPVVPPAVEKEATPPMVVTPPHHVAEQTTPANDWPDPLELADFKRDSAKSEPPVQPEVPAPEETPAATSRPEETSKDDDASPLTSPFLSGAKVEKRPLGGSTSGPAAEPDRAPVFGAQAGEEMTTASPEAQLPPETNEVEPELPEELKGDLMAIEADTTTHHHEQSEATDGPQSEAAAGPTEEEAEPTPASKPAATPALLPQSDEKLLTAGPTSIPQQYHEEPSTGDQDNGAIYDTDTYHQPLAHPAKKKSGWLWVVWIVAILVLGAAGGAALYFLGIV